MNARIAPAPIGEIPPRIADAKRWSVVPLLLCSLMLAAVVILYFFDPTRFGFYPTCMFYKVTGLLCPGCGSLRAMHRLLHGHVQEALRFNALLVVGLPLIGGWCATRKVRRQPFSLVLKPFWVWFGLGLLLLFGILRNLPFAHAHGLAP